MGVPPNHPNFSGIFHEINQLFWGIPTNGNLICTSEYTSTCIIDSLLPSDCGFTVHVHPCIAIHSDCHIVCNDANTRASKYCMSSGLSHCQWISHSMLSAVVHLGVHRSNVSTVHSTKAVEYLLQWCSIDVSQTKMLCAVLDRGMTRRLTHNNPKEIEESTGNVYYPKTHIIYINILYIYTDIHTDIFVSQDAAEIPFFITTCMDCSHTLAFLWWGFSQVCSNVWEIGKPYPGRTFNIMQHNVVPSSWKLVFNPSKFGYITVQHDTSTTSPSDWSYVETRTSDFGPRTTTLKNPIKPTPSMKSDTVVFRMGSI